MNGVNDSLPLTPELTEALCLFCDDEMLEIRSQFCDELIVYFLEDDGIDDHRARGYARTLSVMKQDLDKILRALKQQRNE